MKVKKRFHRHITLDSYPGSLRVELMTPEDRFRKRATKLKYLPMADMLCIHGRIKNICLICGGSNE